MISTIFILKNMVEFKSDLYKTVKQKMLTKSKTEITNIPTLMRAAHQIQYGKIRESLILVDDAKIPRVLSPEEVLVRIHAASINPGDWKLLIGRLSLILRYSFPHILGGDISGIVVAVGSSVERIQVGDLVYASLGVNGGGHAEYVKADQSLFSLKPSNLTMEEAAAIPVACLTSYQAIFKTLSTPINKETKIFICGGAAATGIYAIQLAKAAGAFVATTSSPRNFSLLEKLGYKIVQDKNQLNNSENELLVIDYTKTNFGEQLCGENYDLVCDCVGGEEQWIGAQLILKQSGKFITFIGDDPNIEATIKTIIITASKIISRKFWSIFGSSHHQYILHTCIPNYVDLDDIRTNYIETGKVKPLIDTIYDWRKDGVEALYTMYEKSQSGKAQGKLIMKMTD